MNNETRPSDIEKLDEAWRAIETAVGTLGTMIREATANENALHRYEAYKTAIAVIAENYANQLHFDRQRPECLPSIGPLFNYGAPNPDFAYQVVHIEPGARYRIWGQRGDGALVDLQQVIGWFGHAREPGKPPCVTVANQLFDDQDIVFDEQGNFDFVLSLHPHEGQWWKLEAGITALLLRDYFTDYAAQGRATVFHVDRLDRRDRSSTLPEIEEAVGKLNALANSLRDLAPFVAIPALPSKDGAHVFQEISFGAEAGTSDQRYFQARFNIAPDEALIGKWTIPQDYIYWGITLYNDSYQVLNCANRQVNLNQGLAKLRKDGSFYFVISHRDPGVANWLDVDGHAKGIVMTRIKGCSRPEMPSLQLVPFDDVLKHLPGDIALVVAEERARNLSDRRRHYQTRGNC